MPRQQATPWLGAPREHCGGRAHREEVAALSWQTEDPSLLPDRRGVLSPDQHQLGIGGRKGTIWGI